MVLIFLFMPTWCFGQEEPADGEVIMINPRAPDPMVYKRKTNTLYLGLNGKGESTVYDVRCSESIQIPEYRYYSEKYLINMGCKRFAYGEPE